MMCSRMRLNLSCLFPVALIWLNLSVSGCNESEKVIAIPSVEDSPIAFETPSPALTLTPVTTPTPAPTSTPADGFTERQRKLLQVLGIYEDIDVLPFDDNLRTSALGLIDVLWPEEDGQIIAKELTTFSRTDFNPDLPPSIINRDQYFVQISDDVPGDDAVPDQFIPSALILFNEKSAEESINNPLLIFKPRPGEALQFSTIQNEEGNEYRALLRVNEETGSSNAYTDPTVRYWIEPIYDSGFVLLGEDEESPFYWRRSISDDGKEGLVYWKETGNALPDFPEDIRGLQLHSEEKIDGVAAAYLVDDTQEGVLKKRYIYMLPEGNEEAAWVEYLLGNGITMEDGETEQEYFNRLIQIYTNHYDLEEYKPQELNLFRLFGENVETVNAGLLVGSTNYVSEKRGEVNVILTHFRIISIKKLPDGELFILGLPRKSLDYDSRIPMRVDSLADSAHGPIQLTNRLEFRNPYVVIPLILDPQAAEYSISGDVENRRHDTSAYALWEGDYAGVVFYGVGDETFNRVRDKLVQYRDLVNSGVVSLGLVMNEFLDISTDDVGVGTVWPDNVVN